MSQCVLELSSFSSNTSLLSLAPLPDSSVNYVLIKMLPFVHDALTQLFNVLHICLLLGYCMIPNIIALKILIDLKRKYFKWNALNYGTNWLEIGNIGGNSLVG